MTYADLFTISFVLLIIAVIWLMILRSDLRDAKRRLVEHQKLLSEINTNSGVALQQLQKLYTELRKTLEGNCNLSAGWGPPTVRVGVDRVTVGDYHPPMP